MSDNGESKGYVGSFDTEGPNHQIEQLNPESTESSDTPPRTPDGEPFSPMMEVCGSPLQPNAPVFNLDEPVPVSSSQPESQPSPQRKSLSPEPGPSHVVYSTDFAAESVKWNAPSDNNRGAKKMKKKNKNNNKKYRSKNSSKKRKDRSKMNACVYAVKKKNEARTVREARGPAFQRLRSPSPTTQAKKVLHQQRVVRNQDRRQLMEREAQERTRRQLQLQRRQRYIGYQSRQWMPRERVVNDQPQHHENGQQRRPEKLHDVPRFQPPRITSYIRSSVTRRHPWSFSLNSSQRLSDSYHRKDYHRTSMKSTARRQGHQSPRCDRTVSRNLQQSNRHPSSVRQHQQTGTSMAPPTSSPQPGPSWKDQPGGNGGELSDSSLSPALDYEDEDD